MKRIGLLVVVLAVVLSGPAAWADFYVIGGGGGVGTRITSVPYTISTPGFYYLSGNLTYSGTGYAITVSVDDVTLDLMGFSLTNSGETGSTVGIYMNGRTNVEIRNGTVRGFKYGLDCPYGHNLRAINVRAAGNGYGIYFEGDNHLIKSCNVIYNNTYGIFMRSGIITGCVSSNNGYGIRLLGPGSMLGNTAFNNASYNFMLGEIVSTAILVDRNSALGLNPNYWVTSAASEGVIWGTNAGTP